jgi:hypothetical protein
MALLLRYCTAQKYAPDLLTKDFAKARDRAKIAAEIDAADRANLRPVGTNQHDEAFDNNQNDVKTIRSLTGNSLETLAKNGENVLPTGKITYLPSRQNGSDSYLLRLRKNDPATYGKLVKGEIGLLDARRFSGMKVSHHTTGRAKSVFAKLTEEERTEFLEWLAENLTPEERHKLKEMLG